MRRLLMTLLVCTAFAGLSPAPPASASAYPNRPITLLTMVGPGAQIDLLTRALATALSADLGQPVLVSNNPGGSHGSVMAMGLKGAKPDGYTLGVSATAAFTYTPHFVETRYAFDDFRYITLLGLNQSGVVCAPNRPWNTLKEAFEWARKEKKGLTYMFQGSDDREALKRIAEKEGIKLSLMPSTGGPSVIAAVMGGHADLGHLGAILVEYVKGGKLKLLAATIPSRLSQIPDVPTLREQEWDETAEMYLVLAAPSGLPDAVLIRLEKSLEKLSKDPEFQKTITETLKMAPVPWGRTQAEAYMKQANDRFARQAGKIK